MLAQPKENMLAQPFSKPGARIQVNGRNALRTITNKTAQISVGGVNGGGLKPRQTKVTARRLLQADHQVQEAMETESTTETFQDILSVRVAGLVRNLPAGVTDIDAEDEDNPQLCAEYAPEMYGYLREIEHKYVVKEDYLKGFVTTGKMRTVLVDWLVDVQQQFQLLPETLYLTISFIDRFMSTEGKKITRGQLQLVGVAAMFLASKIEEIYSPEIGDFVYITDDAYSKAEVRAMELNIVQSLNFELGDPLSINFLRRFSKAGDVDVTQHALAKYILESILLDYSLVSLTPSLSAAVSLYLSLGILEEEGAEVWSASLQHYTGYTVEEVHSKVMAVAGSLKKAHTGKFTAVKLKFSNKKMHKIALNDALLAKLALI